MKNARTPLAALAAALVLLTPTALHAQVPQIISYQGRVAVGEPPVNFDGSGAFKFALVDTDGSNTYWSNDGSSATGSEPTAAVTLAVTNGLYSVLLGANMTPIPNSVFANPDVRLRVWFDDGSANDSQLLTPDQRIAAVGYAMVAGSVPGIVHDSGRIGIGTAVPNSRLQVDGDGLVPSLRVQVNGSSKLTVDPNGGTSLGAFVTSPNGPPANGLYVLGDVGIGTLTPTAKLEVAGTVKATSFAGDGSGLTNLNGGSLAAGSVETTQIATGAVGSSQLGSNLTLGGTTIGTFIRNVRTDSRAGVSILSTDRVVLLSGSGPVSVNLSDPSLVPGSYSLRIVSTTSGTKTIRPEAGDYLNGILDDTITLSNLYDRVSLFSDGVSGWYTH